MINRSDVISDDALAAPILLAKNYEKSLKSIQGTIGSVKKAMDDIGKSDSIKEVAESVDTLTQSEAEIIKIQNQLSTALSKSNDEYIEYKRLVIDVNKAVNEKIKFGNIDAKQVNVHNSSITQLNLALQKNRAAYAELKTAKERDSKAGKALLITLQQQDRDLKKLNESMGKTIDFSAKFKTGLTGIDNTLTGGLINRFTDLKNSIGGIAASGVSLGLAAIVGVFVSLKKAAEDYYTSSMSGEEELLKTKAQRDAWFASYEESWFNLGKRAASFKNFLAQGAKAASDLFTSNETIEARNELETKALDIARESIELQKEKMRDTLDDAKTELEVNRLLEISKDKINEKSQDRINALKEGNRLLAEQEKGDIELAQRELKLIQDQIESYARLHGETVDQQSLETALLNLRQKGIASIKEDEQFLLKLTSENYKTAFAAETALIQLQSQASAKRISRLRLESSLVGEINKENIEAAEEAARMLRFLSKEQENANTQSLEDQATNSLLSRGTMIADVAQKLLILKEYGLDVTKLQKQIADKQLAQQQADNAKAEEEEERFRAAILDLQNQAFTTAGQLITNFSEKELFELDARRNRIETAMAEELTAAGDNADAKAAIESKYAAQLKKIDNEERAIKRRRAIAEKALAIFQVAIDTAQAISASVKASPLTFGLPWSAFAAATGALQLAAIASKPVPQFADGVENFKGGLAVVGERGVELVEHGNKTMLTPGVPTLANLPKGANVIPHEETMKRLALQSMFDQVSLDNDNRLVDKLSLIADAQLISSKGIIKAVNKGKTNLAKEGSTLYQYIELENGNRKKIRAKSI